MIPFFKPFLSSAEKRRIASAIAAAEKRTTGEIRVHVVASPPAGDILEAAQRLFHSLDLHKTAARNGVIILVSPSDHRFAIWGDSGIHAKAGQRLWEAARAVLSSRFAEKRYAEGLESCVAEVGLALAEHFPCRGDGGRNELGDEVSET